MAGGDLWTTKKWTNYDDKHAPLPHVRWPEVVESTDETNDAEAVAHYHNNITRGRWEAIETTTVSDGTDPETGKPNGSPDYEIPTSEPRAKRKFARLVGEAERGGIFPLGASEGKETNWVYVEWQANPQGIIHGRPILESRVRDMTRKAPGGRRKKKGRGR